MSGQALLREDPPPTAADQTARIAELVAVIAIVAGHFAFRAAIEDRWSFIASALALGAVYLAVSVARAGRTLASYGITSANLGASATWSSCVVAVVLSAGVVVAAPTHRPVPLDFWLLLAVYPVWGFAQQFLFQGLFHANLLRLGVPASWSIGATTLLFALAHHPGSRLMYLSAAGGLVFSVLFARFRNVVPVGIAHGLCGAIVYSLILHRDPLLRLFPTAA
ncbi:MAG TPA: CPBP family intramembrane glutamic endopeptidase [Myxococcota bacterium]|nr:CPBP family intramembrane glutamic endopeptidase [Myxococcota bacterium]